MQPGTHGDDCAMTLQAMLLSLGLLLSTAASVSGQESCATELRTAYDRGSFPAVLARAEACLAATSDRRERLLILEVEAKSFLARDDRSGAEGVIRRLLNEEPDYAPSITESRAYVQTVATMRRELRRNSTSSVSKVNESLLEAPATVVVVTREQIERRGYTDLEAILHDLPGFDISRSNGRSYSNIYQRGYRSDDTNRTLFLVDGVEQNDLYSNTAYLSRQYPLSNVERIEVIYGPASTMYGANAYLGVISVITREPDDWLKPEQRAGGDAQVTTGPWHTGSLDGTIAGQFRGASASLTARVFRSDEWNASAGWRFDLTSASAKARYTKGLLGPYGYLLKAFEKEPALRELFQSAFDVAISDATAADSKGRNSLPGGYSDQTRDWMLSGKLKLKDLQIGFETWQQQEGATPANTERSGPGALNGNIWAPSQTSIFAKYTAPISRALLVNYFGQAKIHHLGGGSSSFFFQGYLDGPLTANDLEADIRSNWVRTLLSQSSNQIRNEVDVVYRPTDAFSSVAGIDLRQGSTQTAMSQAADCTPGQSFKSINPADLHAFAQQVVASQSLGDTSKIPPEVTEFRRRLVAMETVGGGGVRCTPTGTAAAFSNDTFSGQHYAVRDLGLFAQASYRVTSNVKVVAGLRGDDNAAALDAGTGSVITSRLGLIYSRSPYVFKVIHAQAFKAPSSNEQFSSVPGVYDVALPLEPERTRSLEISAGRQWGRMSFDTSLFRTIDRNVITLHTNDLVENNPDVQRFLERYDAQFQVLTLDMFTNADLEKKLFNDPIRVSRYENLPGYRVWGLQATATGRIGTVDVFGNYSYTNPTEEESGRRVGDIARHKMNLAVANRWNRTDVSLRFNYVGARPTGAGTTVGLNPLTEVPAYFIAHGTVTYDVHPRVSVQAIVNNIFDRQYDDPGVGTADGIRFAATVRQPGRAMFLRLLTRF